MKKRIAIFLNGEGLILERARQALNAIDIIIAADGGANYCLQNEIIPHYIIGDLDSVKRQGLEIPEKSELIHLSDQYSTDLEKALKLAESLDPQSLTILNATGKRSDHAIANLLFLQQINERLPVEVIDNFGRLSFLKPGNHYFNLPVGQTVSFTSWCSVKELTLSGFEYPLNRQSFEGFFVGMSNLVKETPCHVAFTEGRLIMYEVQRFE